MVKIVLMLNVDASILISLVLLISWFERVGVRVIVGLVLIVIVVILISSLMSVGSVWMCCNLVCMLWSVPICCIERWGIVSSIMVMVNAILFSVASVNVVVKLVVAVTKVFRVGFNVWVIVMGMLFSLMVVGIFLG